MSGCRKAAAGFAACSVIRAFALHYGWSLPVYRARAGRTVEKVLDRDRAERHQTRNM